MPCHFSGIFLIKDIVNGKLICSFNQNVAENDPDIRDITISYWQPGNGTHSPLPSAYQIAEPNYIYYITGTLAIIDKQELQPVVLLQFLSVPSNILCSDASYNNLQIISCNNRTRQFIANPCIGYCDCQNHRSPDCTLCGCSRNVPNVESILWGDTTVCCWPESGNYTSEDSLLTNVRHRFFNSDLQ